VIVDGVLKPVAVVNMDVMGPAGTINCNITGMAHWLETQLASGKAPSGKQLFSPEREAEMWAVTTPTPLDPILSAMYLSKFSGYGLGWELSDTHGFKRVSHTGGVLGSVTWVSMIPELNLGVLVLTNQENGGAIEAIGGQILDAYVGAPDRDWVSIAKEVMDERDSSGDAAVSAVAKVTAVAGAPLLPLEAYVGTYHDSWRGDAWVSRAGDQLTLKFSRTASLEGKLTHYSGNIFVVHWNDRSLNADAFVRFEQGYGEKIVAATMKKISPTTDFSYDFQDLNFEKVK